MGLSDQRRRWLDYIGLIVSAGSYCLDCIVLAGLYQEKLVFMLWLVFYWLDGTDGLDGTLVGRG